MYFLLDSSPDSLLSLCAGGGGGQVRRWCSDVSSSSVVTCSIPPALVDILGSE